MGAKKEKPAMTPEAREQQMIALAVDSVEERIRTGKATAQELCHFLKLGTTQAQLQIELLKSQKKMMDAKTESLEASIHSEESYQKAINAMRIYSGHGGSMDEYDEDIY